jgi:hypothetical protein
MHMHWKNILMDDSLRKILQYIRMARKSLAKSGPRLRNTGEEQLRGLY